MEERDRFEAWYLGYAPCPGSEQLEFEGDRYVDDGTQGFWDCWRAALAPRP